MSAKNNRNPHVKTPGSAKSQTPAKVPKSRNPEPKVVKSSLSSYSGQTIGDCSAEPLRMSIRLDDILKTCQKSCNKIALKAELIEPDMDSSVPYIEYIPRHKKQLVNTAKSSKNTEFSQQSRNSHGLNDFSLEKLDADCKQIEDSIISQNNKRVLEDVENAIGSKFNCKVKLKPEKELESVPSVIFVKQGNKFEAFHVYKC